ncbi:hypothetical protein LTR37_018966 [Vermiconidia calcicola]|uniref:Uncharacterized protein n=1 Tax=Vermiconidia calcicola TaxID=1690605 RepID=A0ACC3MH99_9PEZI|nr:hypothetical protein LTR37_018966 [Vermiconidia calcicola]
MWIDYEGISFFRPQDALYPVPTDRKYGLKPRASQKMNNNETMYGKGAKQTPPNLFEKHQEENKALFLSADNVNLPRPQLPPSHPVERACRWLVAGESDYRDDLDNYKKASDESDLLNDLHDVLEDCGAFKEDLQPKQPAAVHSSHTHGGPNNLDRVVPLADVVHVTAEGLLCRKTIVFPKDDGKLFLCKSNDCTLCNAKPGDADGTFSNPNKAAVVPTPGSMKSWVAKVMKDARARSASRLGR